MSSIGISASELAQMRSDIAELFPDSCDILALTITSDGAGGGSESWGTATASVPCRVDYKSGRETVAGAALNPFQSAVISMGYAVIVGPQNRVQVGSNVFSVQSGNAGQSWKAVTRISVELMP